MGKSEGNFIQERMRIIKNHKDIKKIRPSKMFRKDTEIEELINKIEKINFKQMEQNQEKSTNKLKWKKTNFFTRVIINDEKSTLNDNENVQNNFKSQRKINNKIKGTN